MESIQLLDVYRSMAAFTAMEVTDDGYFRMDIGEGEYLPVIAKDGKPVVLPLVERLRDARVNEHEVFHLLSETSAAKANSTDLMTRYRHWAINRINIVIGGLGTSLLRIAADKELCKRLKPDQAEFMQLVVEADTDAADAFDKISELAAKPNQLQRVFTTLYVRPAAVLDGKSYNRVASVNFPFFEELHKLEEELAEHKAAPKAKKGTKPESEVFGVKLRGKDRSAFLGLMQYLIPNLDTKHAYDLGSNSRIAPAMDAMMRAFLPMARHLNDVMEVFKGLDPRMDRSLEEMTFDLDWAEAFENLDVLWPQIRAIPAQSQGVIEEPVPVAAVAAPQANRPQQHQAARAPAPWEDPAPRQTGGGYPSPQSTGYPAPQRGAPVSGGHGNTVSVSGMMHNSMARGGGSRQVQGGYGYPSSGPTQGGYPPPASGGYGGGRRY
jgi:hypothetical protein